MAGFRASSQTQADGYTEAKRLANRAKAFAQATSAMTAVNNVSANAVKQLVSEFKSYIERWTAISGIPGISDYAKAQESDPTYDVAAEFGVMLTAAIAVRDYIISALPKDAVTGRLAIETINADGSFTVVSFTPGDTAGLRAVLDAFAATIV